MARVLGFCCRWPWQAQGQVPDDPASGPRRELQVGVPAMVSSDYINTILTEQEPWFPGDGPSRNGFERSSAGTLPSWSAGRTIVSTAWVVI